MITFGSEREKTDGQVQETKEKEGEKTERRLPSRLRVSEGNDPGLGCENPRSRTRHLRLGSQVPRAVCSRPPGPGWCGVFITSVFV